MISAIFVESSKIELSYWMNWFKFFYEMLNFFEWIHIDIQFYHLKRGCCSKLLSSILNQIIRKIFKLFNIAEETQDDKKNGYNPWPGFHYTGELRPYPVVMLFKQNNNSKLIKTCDTYFFGNSEKKTLKEILSHWLLCFRACYNHAKSLLSFFFSFKSLWY